jgi:hypothetical protein
VSKRRAWSSIVLTLLALAIVYGVGTTFFTIELVLVYPFSLAGVDIRRSVASLFITLGLLVFVLGVLAWFYAWFQRKGRPTSGSIDSPGTRSTWPGSCGVTA